MLGNNLRRMNSTNNYSESWIKNHLKIVNLPLTRDQKINTLNRLFEYKKVNLKYPKDAANITPNNTTTNSNNCSNLIISSKNKPKYQSQINFFPNNFSPIKNMNEKEEKEPIKGEIKKSNSKTDYKRGKLVNIINLSKISMIYRSFRNNDGYKTFLFQKPKTTKNINRKEIDYLDENFKKRCQNTKRIRHKYQSYLNNFIINDDLKQLHKKSKEMLHIKDDLNNLYKDSTNLNNIIDYVSAKLFKLRNNRNEIIKQEISKLNEEKHYKKLVKLKIKRGEIIQNKLFLKKSYLTDDYKIKKNLKAKLIYKNGYSSNSFKAMKNYIKSQTQIDINNKHLIN